MKSLDGVPSLILVQQHQVLNLLKWPAQQSILHPLHYDEQEGEMDARALPSTITIQIQLQTHHVIKSAGVEQCIIQKMVFPICTSLFFWQLPGFPTRAIHHI